MWYAATNQFTVENGTWFLITASCFYFSTMSDRRNADERGRFNINCPSSHFSPMWVRRVGKATSTSPSISHLDTFVILALSAFLRLSLFSFSTFSQFLSAARLTRRDFIPAIIDPPSRLCARVCVSACVHCKKNPFSRLFLFMILHQVAL